MWIIYFTTKMFFNFLIRRLNEAGIRKNVVNFLKQSRKFKRKNLFKKWNANIY